MDGIVFDFDGVLADTMKQHARAYAQVLAPLGITVTERDVFLLEGARSETIIADLAHRAGVDGVDVGGLAQAKQDAFRALGLPRLYPAAAAVLRAASAQGPVAIVTGTRRENLARMLGELAPLVAATLCQEDYSHDKPHPEPFARAAEALGIPPNRLVAVENAIRGVQSAKAAGYGRVIAIETTLAAGDLHEADVVIPDHAGLADELGLVVRP